MNYLVIFLLSIYGIVPKPVSSEFGKGTFTLTPGTDVCLLSNNDSLSFSVAPFGDALEDYWNAKPVVRKASSAVKEAINVSLDSSMKREGYTLNISKGGIDIKGGSPAGVFYAFQSLRQLLPLGRGGMKASSVELPEAKIKDEPYFAYRGAMLDVGRYFFPEAKIKEFLDVMAMHKLNVFHWHLTEDGGWRIEIKKYPNLAKIGSVRERSVLRFVKGKPPVFDDKPHGGFYTQEEIKDIVRYAAEHFITIIPEIDMPGHSSAALASYPWLGCKGKDYKVETIWRITDEAFCPGKESTFRFLDDVFSELVQLFPSEYIHIGGDECRKVRWQQCPMCQKRIHDENLKDENGLQSYFIKRVEKMLAAKGRKVIGWDEILQGGVSPTATVMSWQGTKGGIEAAKMGNHVIMSPSSFCYLDYYQTKDRVGEPYSIGNYLPVDSVYSFDPYKGLTKKESSFIMGVQANIWTAFINNMDTAYYMALPRLAAVAEVAWSYKNSTLDYPDFRRRMQYFRYLYERKGLPYAKYMFKQASPGFSVYRSLCEQVEDPVAIGTGKPRFSWQATAQQRGFEQTAYRILVADTEEQLANNNGNVWDSGKTGSDASILVSYGGKPLESQHTYYWKVEVWDKAGTPSGWGSTNQFSIGLLDEKDWGKAKWIAFEPDRKDEIVTMGITGGQIQKQFGDKKTGMYKLPLFRKEFTVKKDVKRATAYVSGLGQFDLFLNGAKAGNHFMDPGWTKYDVRALYVAFDITGQVHKGGNAAGVMLGNGFYNIPRERYLKMLTSYGAPKMILKIRLEYADGSREEIVSDKSWKAAPGPITFSSIYGGEDYDANLVPEGWLQAGYDDSDWKDALLPDWTTKLILQQSPSLKVRDELSPVRIFQTQKGDWVYDMGQNFSGIIRMRVRAGKDESVEFYPAELLNPDSTVNQSASGRPFYFTYKVKGDTTEAWQPQFTYYGFRYVQLKGAVPAGKPNPRHLPEIVSLEGLHTCGSARETGTFICSNDMFNDIYRLIDWSVRSNLASVLTDCPHREKLGWLEVAHLMFYSIQYRYDVAGFYRKVMEDMCSTQAPDGQIPTTAPELVKFSTSFQDTPEWGSAFIIIPWYVYQCYGDDSLFRDYYQQMRHYIGYLTSKASDNIISYGLGDWFDIGPAGPGESQLTSKGVTATAIYYYDVTIMQKIASLTGHDADALEYKQLASAIKESFNKTFWNASIRRYDRNSQAANSMALYTGLAGGDRKEAVFHNLVKDIRDRGNALTAGDVGYRYVLRALEANGASDVIYDMNSRYDVPGYGWQLAHGATSLTESWQAYGFVSNNHCMLGHLMEWLFSGVGGIRQPEGSIAFKEVLIKADPVGDIREADASFESPYGRIRSHWKRDGDAFSQYVEIPPNSKACVCLPTMDLSRIYESGLSLDDRQDILILRREEGHTLVEIGSGMYRFRVKQ